MGKVQDKHNRERFRCQQASTFSTKPSLN